MYDFLLRECDRSYPFKILSIFLRSTFTSRANWLLLIFILELSISKFNFGKSSSPLISISVLISICICIIFTPKILCITNHLLYILIQSFMYIVRVSFIKDLIFFIKIAQSSDFSRDNCMESGDNKKFTQRQFKFMQRLKNSLHIAFQPLQASCNNL